MRKPSKEKFRQIFVDFIGKSEPFATVLDCASAGDKFIGYFPGKKYTGVDIAPDAIAEAKRKNHPNAEFYVDDLTHFTSDVKNKRFDLVVCTHTLHLVRDEQKVLALKNLASLLKPNGSLIVQAMNPHASYVRDVANSFRSVQRVKYRGFFSRIFEDTLEVKGKKAGPILAYTIKLCTFFLVHLDGLLGPDSSVFLLSGKKDLGPVT